MNAKRDENFVTSVLGVDGNGNVVVIEADGSTSRLLLDITPVADTSPSTLSSVYDGKHVPVPVVELDDGSGTTPLMYENTTGLLFVDVLEE